MDVLADDLVECGEILEAEHDADAAAGERVGERGRKKTGKKQQTTKELAQPDQANSRQPPGAEPNHSHPATEKRQRKTE
jgi:hypothetical protein